MKTMTAISSVLMCLLAACASTGTERRAVEAPTPEALIERHIEASGGRERLSAIKARVMTGRVSLPMAGIQGQFAMAQATGGKSLTAITIAGLGSEVLGSDGERVWSLSSTTGNRFLDGEELTQRKPELLLSPELQWDSLYPSREVKGEKTLGEQRCWVVVFTTPAGHAYTHYFDQATGLSVGVDMVQISQMGAIPVQQRYFDFRDVDGVKLPFLVSIAGMGMEQIIEVDVIAHPDEVAPEAFIPPQL